MADQKALEREIRRLIAAAGPMPVADYMRLCLSHPEYGYYITHDPLGVGGDFITAPEISQMFGELIGLWMAAGWQQLGGAESGGRLQVGRRPAPGRDQPGAAPDPAAKPGRPRGPGVLAQQA